MLRTSATESGSAVVGQTIGAVLANDHRRLDDVFQGIVSQASGGDLDHLRQSWSAFERELLAHLDGEETFILRAFAGQRPLEAKRILAAHNAIRHKVTEMGVDLDLHCLRADRVQDLLSDLRRHARTEELVVYPWADARLGTTAADDLRRALWAAHNAGRRAAPLELWRIDVQRSTLSFSLRHLVLLEIKGSFAHWGGTIWFDRADPARSKVKAWIDLNSVETGDAERDQHLRSPEFLDVARFPQATYASLTVGQFDEGPAVVHGILGLHGAKVPVDLEVELKPAALAATTDHLRCDVRGALDRQRFGLHWNQDLDIGGLVLGDTIHVNAQIEAFRIPR